MCVMMMMMMKEGRHALFLAGFLSYERVANTHRLVTHVFSSRKVFFRVDRREPYRHHSLLGQFQAVQFSSCSLWVPFSRRRKQLFLFESLVLVESSRPLWVLLVNVFGCCNCSLLTLMSWQDSLFQGKGASEGRTEQSSEERTVAKLDDKGEKTTAT